MYLQQTKVLLDLLIIAKNQRFMERNTLAASVFANSNIYAKHNLQVLVQNALEVFLMIIKYVNW